MKPVTLAIAAYADTKSAITTIRHAVFQVEQGVDPSLDFDGLDGECKHALAWVGDRPVGTARIRYLSDRVVKIERLAVLAEFRGLGIGRQIMEFILEFLRQTPIQTVQLHAQLQVKGLYDKLGFAPVGEIFVEAGIAHLKMQKTLSR